MPLRPKKVLILWVECKVFIFSLQQVQERTRTHTHTHAAYGFPLKAPEQPAEQVRQGQQRQGHVHQADLCQQQSVLAKDFILGCVRQSGGVLFSLRTWGFFIFFFYLWHYDCEGCPSKDELLPLLPVNPWWANRAHVALRSSTCARVWLQ